MKPYDKEKPSVASGIRLGSPALTTRGLETEEFQKIAEIIDTILRGHISREIKKELKNKISYLTRKFSLDKI